MSTLIRPMRIGNKGPETIISGGRHSVRRRVWSLPIGRAQERSSFKASRLLRRADGSQLLELALSLPIMLVVMVGVVDFGQAWNIKQKLANAVREGTRIGASAPSALLDATNCGNPVASSPCSVQAVADAVKQYMVNASLNASCITPNSPSSSDSTTSTWTYSCNGLSISITRPYIFTASSGAQVLGTHVSLTYPYTWTLNHVIGLLGGSSILLPSIISTSSVMANGS
jgi:Flp pilus assembly protein TadG